MSDRRAVVLDTDIGTDVDDAMALALLLGSDVDLDLVTTVYGDVGLRARLAQRYAGLAGRRLRVVPGRSATASGKPVWWAGHEGSLHADLDDEQVEAGDGVAALVERVTAEPGAVDVVAIGPLTDVAAALEIAPALPVRGLWVMGGSFADDVAEHNLACDAVAAHRVLSSGLPTVVAGLEITRQVRIGTDQLERIGAAGPLGAALAADIRQWWQFWGEHWNVPHDPVAVLAMLRPDLLETSDVGRVEIEVAAPGEPGQGRSTFVPDPTGTTRVVTAVDADAVGEEIVRAIERAGAIAS